jgi:hypothetical protein
VALVTGGGPVWTPRVVERTDRSTTIRFARNDPAAAVVLLNAARVDRLAARTRSYLSDKGWRSMAIGNASQVREQSAVLYPAGREEFARRIARQFGFPMKRQPWKRRDVVVLLGRDAVIRRSAGTSRA